MLTIESHYFLAVCRNAVTMEKVNSTECNCSHTCRTLVTYVPAVCCLQRKREKQTIIEKNYTEKRYKY